MKLILFANTDWYLFNFRRSLALAIREAGHDLLLISPGGPYGPKLRELGLRWEAVPMDRRSLDPVREGALLAYLTRLFRRERPDIVHGFTIKCAVYGSLAARAAGVPGRVNAVAGMGYVFISDERKAKILRPIVRRLLQQALGGKGARLILQNPDDTRLFEEAGLVKRWRVRLIPGSGVDTERFVPGERGEEAGRLRVVLPARLLWDKGLAEYVEASGILRERGVEAAFLLAGTPDPGNPAAVPEEDVQRWVRDGLVEWLGHVDDMPALFRSVDVVALPSYREGLPKGLIEAGASGCALVTTDAPGCREVVTHEVDGLLVPVKDPVALADAIERLAKDPELRTRLGKAARAKVLERFDERIVIAETLKVYEELAAAQRGR